MNDYPLPSQITPRDHRITAIITSKGKWHAIATAGDRQGTTYFLYYAHLDSFGPTMDDLRIGTQVTFTPIENGRLGWRAVDVRVTG